MKIKTMKIIIQKIIKIIIQIIKKMAIIITRKIIMQIIAQIIMIKKNKTLKQRWNIDQQQINMQILNYYF